MSADLEAIRTKIDEALNSGTGVNDKRIVSASIRLAQAIATEGEPIEDAGLELARLLISDLELTFLDRCVLAQLAIGELGRPQGRPSISRARMAEVVAFLRAHPEFKSAPQRARFDAQQKFQIGDRTLREYLSETKKREKVISKRQ